MKVKALTNIKYGADWHCAGEVFEIHDDDLGELTGLVEKTEETVSPRTPAQTASEHEPHEKPKRTTTRKRRE